MTIISDIITGVIAGLAGALTAVISVRLQDKSRRRFDHHLKHKENFEVLKGAIRKVSSEIYPYIRIGSKEKPFMPENYKVNYKFWESYSIFSYIDMINKGGKTYEIRRIDKLLYNDIKNHWPEFYNKLNEWNGKIKVMGVKSNEIMKTVFDTIYNRLIKELNIKAIPSPTSLKKNPMLLQDYALAVYNFVMGTNPDEWPNLYSNMKSLKITDQLKKFAEDVKHKKSEELKDFYSNVKLFLDTAEDLITNLDKLIHDEKIKHNCEYIK